MRSFFFGTRERKLFGIHHPPSSGTSSRAALLCYPGLHEYNASHSAFRVWANLLSDAGFHVLRFDYFGTGDAQGTSLDVSWEGMLSDVATAKAELLDAAGADRCVLGGFRLGADLAMRHSTTASDVAALALWEPVLDGPRYLKNVRERDVAENKRLLRGATSSPPGTLLGYLVDDPFLRQLAEDLLSKPPLPGSIPAGIFSSSDLRSELPNAGSSVRFFSRQSPPSPEGTALFARPTLMALTQFLLEASG